MDLIGNCMRCGKWFDGEQCPGCDGDKNSRYVDPPEWAGADEPTPIRGTSDERTT